MDEIRWGIIGVGEVVRLKSGAAFATAPGSRVVAVCARTPGAAAEYAAANNISGAYVNARELINDPDVNAVYIATPPGSHAELAIGAARAGKAVYVEKPMATTHADCLKMIDACKNVPLCVAYYRRALPKFLKIKELLDAGAIGDVRCVSVSGVFPPRPVDLDPDNPPWRAKQEIAGPGGYFMDMVPHQLDVLDFFLGPIAAAHGGHRNLSNLYPADDTFCASLRFDSGILAAGAWCFTAGKSAAVDRTEITGSKGSIVFSTFDWGPFRLLTPGAEETFDLPYPPVIQQPMIERVVGSLLGKCENPCDGATGARTNKVIDAILGLA